MTKIKKIVISDSFFFVLCFLLFLVLERHVIPIDYTDDAVFAQQLREMGIWKWSSSFYMTWSGRLILTLLDAIFLNLPVLFWKVFNAAVFANMMLFLMKITEAQWMRFGLIAMVLSIPQVTLSSSTLWITGSLNYLWPTSFLMVILYYCKCLFFHEPQPKWLFMYSLVASFFACNMEQTAAVCLTMLVISLCKSVLQKEKMNKESICLLVFVILNCMFLFLAPGNYVRSLFETVQWNPSFDMMTVLDKIFTGCFAAIRYVFNDMRRLMLLLSMLILFIRPFSFWNGIPFLLFLFSRNQYSFLAQNLFNVQDYHPLFQQESFMWGPFLCCVLLFVLIIYFVMNKSNSWEEGLWQFLIFCASYTSSCVIGLSPTLAGSGQRIYFLMAILLICGIMRMIFHHKYEKMFVVFVWILMFPSVYSNVTAFLSDYGYLFLF